MAAPRSIKDLENRISEPPEYLIELFRGWEGDICVPGAGGKMGWHLCLMLQRIFQTLGLKDRIVAVSRFSNPAGRHSFEKAGIATLSLDLTDAAQVAKLPGAEAIIYLAGKKFGTQDSLDELRLFNQKMPRMVAEHYAGTPVVAYSTGCVYPFVEPVTGGSLETDQPDPVGAYAVSCLGREAAFCESSAHSGAPLALIRLNYAVDLQYGVLVDLAQKIWNGEPIDISTGYFNCVWQGDAIAHSLASLFHAEPAPDPLILNVTGSETFRVRDVAALLADRLGKIAILQGEEAPTAWLSNAAKSHERFGSPRIDGETLIEWVADWIANGRPLLGKATQFEIRDGKY